MKLIRVLPFVLLFITCVTIAQKEIVTHDFSTVEIEVVLKDSLSIRALDVFNDSLIGFGFDRGYGFINMETQKTILREFEINDTTRAKKNWITEQRAVGFTDEAFFSLGVGSPARLRKIDRINNKEKIVYIETHKKVFYDAIAFWNSNEGIAMGDPTEDCLSILITRDKGESWKKLSCDDLPKTVVGEAAFAASNGNIAIVGNKTWIVSGGTQSRVFYSPDKGTTWEVFDTPLIDGKETTGVYSIDFYDDYNGIVFGGDYTKPAQNKANKAITKNGGKTWQLVSDASGPGYKSCIRYVPNSGGKEMIAVGFTGISFSNDFGKHWKEISKEGFYIARFLNDSTAIAGGKGRVAKLTFK
ncbi:oxidoreductase [Aquimarina sp. I32.4]|uniref:WD40/YVTN/BNR-like repeat-containing protein n=1 Tax=Aquimarina sp. I32.4 TaxID=2053903 RepID=UPI000CDE82C6|nr:oxidoreductase [Aquimarina sp. I32.4]